MFTIILTIVLVVIAIAMIGFTYRLIKGPSIPDRVIALDAIGVCLISIIAILSILMETSTFLDVILLLSILSFIGTASFSKFLAKGAVFDRERDT